MSGNSNTKFAFSADSIFASSSEITTKKELTESEARRREEQDQRDSLLFLLLRKSSSISINFLRLLDSGHTNLSCATLRSSTCSSLSHSNQRQPPVSQRVFQAESLNLSSVTFFGIRTVIRTIDRSKYFSSIFYSVIFIRRNASFRTSPTRLLCCCALDGSRLKRQN